jgi:thiol-disulfide isomerase/thioredoxin
MKKSLYLLAIICIQFSQLHAQRAVAPIQDSINTYITVKVQNRTKSDTISITLNSPFFDFMTQANTGRHAVKTIMAIKNVTGEYHFVLKTSKSPFHISLFLSNDKLEDYVIGRGDIVGYLIMPGSNLNINFDGSQKIFTGSGAEIFEVQDKIENCDKDSKILDDNTLTATNTPKWLQREDSLLNAQLSILDNYKSKIPPMAYSILRADVVGLNRGAVYYWLSWTQPFMAKRADLSATLIEGLDKLGKDPIFVNLKDPAVLSPKYIFYLYEKTKLQVKYERIVNKRAPKIDQNYFPKIKLEYDGVLRDKLLARWITDLAAVNNLHDNEVIESLELMQSPFFIQMVNTLNSAYKKGLQITDFNFKNPQGQTINLANFKGKVVVVDMWFTGCPECVAVVNNMPSVEDQFKGRDDIAFVTISIDRNKNEWLKSINRNGGKYYVSDNTIYLYTSGTGTRNPFIERYVPGNGYPQLMIIGKNGKMFSASLPHPINEKLKGEFVNAIKSALVD